MPKTATIQPKLVPIVHEGELLRQIAVGDDRAFHEIYKRYHGIIFQTTLMYVKDPLVAEELVQSIFVKLWEKRTQLCTLASFKDYLFILSRNLVFDHVKQMAKQADRRRQLYIQTWLTDFAHNDTELESKESARLHQQAIDQLPGQRKKIYQLFTEEEVSLNEIASTMGLAKVTVKKHLQLARLFVRAFMRDHLRSFVIPLMLTGWW